MLRMDSYGEIWNIIKKLKDNNFDIIPKKGKKILDKLDPKKNISCFCHEDKMDRLYSNMECLCASHDFEKEEKQCVVGIVHKEKKIGVIKINLKKNEFNFCNEVISGYLLNTIHNEIPNFVFLYDIINLPPREYLNLIDKKCAYYDDTYQYGKLIHKCIVYEYIDGIDYCTFCQKNENNLAIIFETIIQAILALDYAYHKFYFSHCDICAPNLFFVENKEKKKIVYRNYTMVPNYIVKYIDFDQSSCIIPNDEKEYMIGYYEKDNEIDLNYLLTTFYITFLENDEIRKLLTKMYCYLNPDVHDYTKDKLREIIANYCRVPSNNEIKIFDKFIDHCYEVFGEKTMGTILKKK